MQGDGLSARPSPVWAGLAWARASALRGFPTNYLLPRPTVDATQLGQRRTGTEIMVIERRTAGARDVEETKLSLEKQADRGFVRGIQHGATGAALARYLETEVEGHKCFAIRLLEFERAELRPVQAAGRAIHAIRKSQRVLDRQPHVGRG